MYGMQRLRLAFYARSWHSRAMIMTEYPSPNHDERQAVDGDARVRHVIVHYTGMTSRDAALTRLSDPTAKVSAHYFIDQEGVLFRMVSEERRAWHAGVSFWRGLRDLNSASIGIELCNPGHEYGYRPFPDIQITALKALLADIHGRHNLGPTALLGHSDIAPSRKMDPGELLPWRDLATDGFGLWPAETEVLPGIPDLDGAFRRLSEIGYAVPLTPEEGSDILNPDSATTDVVTAFQRRYRPQKVDGHLDNETAAQIAAVAVAHALARAAA